MIQIPVFRDNLKVGTAYTINQQFSSYAQTPLRKILTVTMTHALPIMLAITGQFGYRLIQINPNWLKMVGKRFIEKTIEQNFFDDETDAGNVTTGHIELRANFKDKFVEGEVTQRTSGKEDIQLQKRR